MVKTKEKPKKNNKIKARKSKRFDLKNILLLTKDNLFNFVKYNRQFISFVILSLFSCSFVRLYTIGKFWNFQAMFFDLAVILLLGCLAYLFKPKKQYRYFMIVLLIITLMNIINSVYYAFFTNFVSFGLISTLGQAATQGGAVMEKLKITDFIYLLFPLILMIIHFTLKKKDYFSIVESIEVGKKLFVGVAILGGIVLSINISTLSTVDISRFSKQWNREYIVERFGIIIYQLNDGVQTIKSNVSSMFGYDEAEKNFIEYYTENPYTASDNKYTNKFKGYNVIVMHLESMMSFLVDLKINGEEVTPNLNKLVHEGMYFDNFYSQVSVGTSSDTEFTFNTSLMPVQSGTVFVSYYNREYNSLEKLLGEKNYYTFSMHGNKASMWNRAKMHQSLGYKDFYAEDYYDIDEVIGLGLSDHSFFIQGEQLIDKINDMVKENEEYSNYMGTIITLSNHTPFADPYYLSGENSFDVTYHTGKLDENGLEIIQSYLEDETIGNYLKSVHYADKCLGEYIEYVKSSGTYDKTLFVMYGDHAAQLSRKQYGYFVNYDFETGEQKSEDDPTYVEYDYYANELFKNVPLILWTPNGKIKGTVSYPMGMIDVLPTIGNMLDFDAKYALGNDIFEVKNNNTVVFPNGNFLTDKLYYYNSKNEYRTFGSEIIDEDYIEEHKKYTEKILNVSNDIIVYDLIRTAGDKLLEGTKVNE